ncbi:CLUMA_CG020438, isoform A [Clunio marinus]|uniref:DNA-directed RNA polymerase II subunit RPB7 n=1 Tax=Clunio marinus TaxID=568069 RepID=A0A1J1J7M2_9DIPT|nr:CLUMA_CG020438, isoform A [Clunio marinus]
MFVLAELKSTVKVHPSLFSKGLSDVAKFELNKKLANKVLHKIGLMISFREVVSFQDSSILPVDGSSHTDVIFRYIVFRPEIGSLLTGKIKSCARDGIYVTLGFFDDIFIPKDELQHPSRFEEAEQAWVWEYPVEGDEKHDLFMDVGETVKFRIIDEEFVESEPSGPPDNETSSSSTNPSTDHNSRPPYKIIGAINESGLGIESWWTQNEVVDDDDEDDDG